jgi:hypothetical protein
MDMDPSFNLEAKFDGLDIPPGVEASVPWLQKCFGSGSGSSSGSDLNSQRLSMMRPISITRHSSSLIL